MLTEEIGKATNIKDRVNRQSVIGAMTSTQERLKLYTKTPNNGLILFCGTILSEDGKTEKKVVIDFEPYKPINQSLYQCDNLFHTEPLRELLDNDQTFGFIIVDGNGALYGTLQGNARDIKFKFTVELPKKHGRGGQSSVRFARLRMEKRHNYLRKVCEIAVQQFIEDNQPNVAGLVLAGSADFKNELATTQMFDPRLAAKIVKVVDVSYGGENGFNQAIELSLEALQNVRFVQEKKLITQFFEEISKESGLYVYGIDDTMSALAQGAVEKLVLYENLEIRRVTCRLKEAGVDENDLTKLRILYLLPHQCLDSKYFKDKQTQQELDIIENVSFTEWISENYTSFGATLFLITNKSPEGFQFVKGFGGIGGLLRYKLDMEAQAFEDYQDDEDGFI
eukprot:TRINITY_DN1169_c0_g1_i4.p1 TRINITY_DN1169_c0_g1~~TRINITY_DN1169_c0_g1_i4.p1  ORF type:complete len:394 (+),score=94.45 TRINITY_DN1169_c0_g1_i4:207-1388(+)